MRTLTSDRRALRWTRPQALAILGSITALIVCSLIALYGPRTAAAGGVQTGGRDLEAYRAIVERVHQGEDYYSAAGAELRARGYATSSVFNWRPPIYAWLLAAFPAPEWAQALLGLLALLALGLAYAGDREGGSVGRSLVLLAAMAGALLWCIDGDAFFAQELWAGVLIAVSVGCFAVNQRAGGVAAGLAALGMRELALPYVAVSILLACREKRWREVAIWCAGVACYGAFLIWHAWQVQQHLTGQELTEMDGWIQFGGPAFVIRTSQMNAWLFNLPGWISVLYLAVALIGLAGWRGSQALRVGLTVVLYLSAFLVVGKSFNAYWGLLYVALLPLGLVRAAPALRDLATAILSGSFLGCTSAQTYHDGK